jgi:hypothetical protein
MSPACAGDRSTVAAPVLGAPPKSVVVVRRDTQLYDSPVPGLAARLCRTQASNCLVRPRSTSLRGPHRSDR